MPIFICKNCGNLTETEAVEGLTCSKCSAPLEEKKPEKEEKSAPPIQIPTSQSTSEQKSTDESVKKQEPAVIPADTQEPSEESTPEQKPVEQVTSDQETPAQPSSSLSQSPIDLPSSPIPPESGSQAQTSSSTAPTLMEVYENKDLVACPQCGYGCDASWATCPICEAKISDAPDLKKITEAEFTFDEKATEENLVACPKCNYFCDPNWQNCPICQTELKKSE